MRATLVLLTLSGAIAFAPGALPAGRLLQKCTGMRAARSSNLPVTMLFGARKTGKNVTPLRAAAGGGSLDVKQVERFVAAVKTSTWFSWWAQVILSVVSAVTLFFANAVKGAAQGNILSNGIFLAGVGLALSFVNIAWTATYASSANKLATAVAEGKEVKTSGIAGTVKIGVIVALSGMFVTLLGAEQIVGTLVAKSISGSLMYAQGAALAAQASNMQLQALDIFVVQANTNTLLSHLASLVCSLYIAARRPSN